MLRCHICDFDILHDLCDDLGRALWDDIGIWPRESAATDGVITGLTQVASKVDMCVNYTFALSSETANFKHGRKGSSRPDNPILPATLVNILGWGFYKVVRVVSNTEIVITTDERRPSMMLWPIEQSGYSFVVGGYTPQIQRAFERISSKLDADKVSTQFRGADFALMWAALELIMFRAYRNNESSYKDKYEEAKIQREVYEGELNFSNWETNSDANASALHTCTWGRS